MSKQYHIRWTQSDSEQLKKAVKNFNAKISRLEKKNPGIKNALPDRVSVKQMKELISTRQDLKRELNALRRFSKRGAEKLVDVPDNDYNLKMTKWQKNEMSRRVAVINRKRNKRHEDIANIELKSRGESLGYTHGQVGMGKADEVALRPMKAFTPKMTTGDLKKKFKTIMKESQSNYWNIRETRMVNNYIKSLEENYNPKDVEDIIEIINTMSFNDFLDVIISEDPKFEFPYPPDSEQYEQYLSALRSIFTPHRK